MKKLDPIHVTRPSMPSLQEFNRLLEAVWSDRILTNNGPLHQALESQLCEYLGVKHISLFSNGTLALITALKALDIEGEVITTPFTFVATASALAWSGLTPVFSDIDPLTWNLDAKKIEEKITGKTSAILPVHCYGRSCDVEGISSVAEQNGLRVIYDAAHAFGVDCHCGSLLEHGDLSVLSFHATKVFNTFEGGAIVSHSSEMKLKIDRLKNFGIIDEVSVAEVGINAKMSEISAAMGLLQLRWIDQLISLRREVDRIYRNALGLVAGVTLPAESNDSKSNYAYFPILVEEAFPLTRDELYEELKKQGIFTRRYFYPLITDLSPYQSKKSQGDSLKVARDVASRVLCLPIYPELKKGEILRIVNAIGSVET